MADALDEFASIARDYCAWCDEPGGETDKVFRLLSRLVATIIDVPLRHVEGSQARNLSHEQWKEVFDRFRPLPFSYYKLPLDPQDLDAADDGIADLSDDLADIWRDLVPGLGLFDEGRREQAAWHWRFHFNIHWGQHATSAMYALHCWLSNHRADP